MSALPELIRSLTAGADALWSASASRSAAGEIACRPGCIGCCTGLFSVSAAEGLLVRAAVDALPPRERETVRAAAEAIRAATDPFFPGDSASGVLASGREPEIERFVERTHAIPCPLLDVRGRCRIYASRPLTCRTFGLALVHGSRVESAACALNAAFAGGPRAVETGLQVQALDVIERQADTALVAAGRDPAAETTIPHAIAGRAFAA